MKIDITAIVARVEARRSARLQALRAQGVAIIRPRAQPRRRVIARLLPWRTPKKTDGT